MRDDAPAAEDQEAHSCSALIEQQVLDATCAALSSRRDIRFGHFTNTVLLVAGGWTFTRSQIWCR